MKDVLIQFAQTESSTKPGMFEALGIDWKLLILQTVAFLLLVFLLGKYVYPRLIKMIDDRQAKIDDSVAAAELAQKKAEAAESAVEDELKKARADAAIIVETARQEAADKASESEKKAAAKAEYIVKEAQAELAAEISKARDMLHKETIELVAYATEKIVKQKIDAKADASLIKDALGKK
jgi:F-type H+-transporting ATPase subunit b